ncbi:MAG TPA: hypothetical protein VMH86_00090 [Rhizomicrobium sp.]|nr:hypothetical protein [Rhizomicrobium sp.]
MSDSTIARHDPANVGYVNQWSLFAVTHLTANTDRIDMQVDLAWKSIGRRGQGNVMLSGLPVDFPSFSCPEGSGGCLYFANGSGKFGGFTAAMGSQLGADSNEIVGPVGLAYITVSTQSGALPTNLQWRDGIGTGRGEFRVFISYFAHDTELQSWLAAQPPTTLQCGL